VIRRALVLGVALAITACAAKPPPAPSASPAAVIEYRRTGGLAGIDDRITVSPEGLLEVRNRQGRRTSAQLSPGDLKELESLLSGWQKLAAGVPHEPVTPDAFEYSITHDGVTISTVEFSHAPEAFDLVRKRLEGMAERAR